MHEYLTLLHSLDRVLDRPADLRDAIKAVALAAPDSKHTPSLLDAMCNDSSLGVEDQLFLLEFPNAEVRRYTAQQQGLSLEMWERYLRFETDEKTLTSLRGIAPVHQLSRGALNLLFAMPEDATDVTPEGAEQILACAFDSGNERNPLWAEALIVRGVPEGLGAMEVQWYGDPVAEGGVTDVDLERVHPMYQLAYACSPQATDGSLTTVLTAHPDLVADNPHANVALSWIRRVARVPVNRGQDLAFITNAESSDLRRCIEPEFPVGLPDAEMMLWAIENSRLTGAMSQAPTPADLADCWIRLAPEMRTDELATALIKGLEGFEVHTRRVVALLGEQFHAAVEPLLADVDPAPRSVGNIPAWLIHADAHLWVVSLSRLMGDDRIRSALNQASPELLDLAVEDLMDRPAAWLARPVLFLAEKVGFGPDQWDRLTADHMTTFFNAAGDEDSAGKQLARWLFEQVTSKHLTHPLGAVAAVELTQLGTAVGDVLTAARVIA